MFGRLFAPILKLLVLAFALWGAGQFFSIGRFLSGWMTLVGLVLAVAWFSYFYRLMGRIEAPLDAETRELLAELEKAEAERTSKRRWSYWKERLQSLWPRKQSESSDELHLRFWDEWIQHLARVKSPLQPKKVGALRWLDLDVGRTGFKLAATFSEDGTRLGMELKMFGPHCKESFEALRAQRAALEAQLGFALEWVPEWHVYRAAVYRPDSPLTNQRQWKVYRKWLTQVGGQMDGVFRPLIHEFS